MRCLALFLLVAGIVFGVHAVGTGDGVPEAQTAGPSGDGFPALATGDGVEPELGDTVIPLTNSISVGFDGINDYAQVLSNYRTNVTFSLWLKVPSSKTGVNNFVFHMNADASPNSGACLGMRAPSDALVILHHGVAWGSEEAGSPDINDDQWHHVIVRLDSDAAFASEVYLDGTQLISKLANAFIVGTNVIMGGLFNGGSVAPGQCSIDEVAVWDTVLSTAEMAELYALDPYDVTMHSRADDLVGFWRMGDGDTYPTITDRIGDSDATMYNMSATNFVEDVP